MCIIKIWRLKIVAGQLSDRPKVFAGQNENLPVLSDSPAVFAKTAKLTFDPRSNLCLHIFVWGKLKMEAKRF